MKSVGKRGRVCMQERKRHQPEAAILAPPVPKARPSKRTRKSGLGGDARGEPAAGGEQEAGVPSALVPAGHASTTDGPLREQLRETILALVSARSDGATCCPSEAPRRVRPSDWRPLMALTREVAFELAREGVVQVTQKGAVVTDYGNIKGPIRLRRPP
ncbi:hypothetical protein FOA52_013467 [Chlamydomonas sp. UWO 241]|nr:hypothetical protein FOA52_013467 [Chlamydomonas sp. UWO 241]